MNTSNWLVHHDLEKQARWRSEKDAIVFEEESYTYRSFNQRVNQLSWVLNDLGIEQGDRVLVHAHNHSDLYVIFYACSKIGAVFSPVSKFQPPENVRFICNNIEPKIVFYSHHEDLIETVNNIRESAPTSTFISIDRSSQNGDRSINELADDYPDNNPPGSDNFSPNITHNIFWTSGTTGKPKAVVRNHRDSLQYASPLVDILPQSQDTTRIAADEMMLIAPYLQYGIPTIMSGSKTVILEEFDPEEIFKAAEENDNVGMFLGFTQSNVLFEYLDKNEASIDMDFIHAVIESGEQANRLSEITEELFHLYGSTEIGIPIVTRLEPSTKYETRPPVGIPGGGADIRLVKSTGNEDDTRHPAELSDVTISPGNEGELICRGQTTLTKFLQSTNQEEKIHDGWVSVGDVMRVTDSGELVYVGRVDNRIRSGGVNTQPEDVENVLETHDDVAKAIVVGVDDEKWGQMISAIIIPNSHSENVPNLPEILDDFCKDHDSLSDVKRPKQYRILKSIDDVPTKVVGKIDRDAVISEFFS